MNFHLIQKKLLVCPRSYLLLFEFSTVMSQYAAHRLSVSMIRIRFLIYLTYKIVQVIIHYLFNSLFQETATRGRK